MPGDEDIIAIPIPGLVRGAEQNPNCKTEGLLVFVRGNVDVESETFTDVDDDGDKSVFSKDARIAKLYRERIYYPFIESIRAEFGHNDPYNVPDHLRVVAWQDGCDGQLKLVTSEESLEEDGKRNIVACKQNAARTGSEQAADLAEAFRGYRKEEKGMDVTETNHRNRGLKRKLENSIRDRISVLVLETFKFNAIVHLLAKTPSCQSESYSFDNICSGFLANGQISALNSPVPDIYGCLGTLRYEYPDTSIEHLTKMFNKFYLWAIKQKAS